MTVPISIEYNFLMKNVYVIRCMQLYEMLLLVTFPQIVSGST